MVSLAEKKKKLNGFIERMCDNGNPEVGKVAKLMVKYKEFMSPYNEAAECDLIEFLDGLSADQVPQDNGFLDFMRKNKV